MSRLSSLSRSIHGKVVLITGAGSGMGRATAHLFADEGARVAVVDMQHERVDRVVAEIAANGGSAHGWVADVADPIEVKNLVAGVATEFGGIDILVNNAGIAVYTPISCSDEEFEAGWTRTVAVNLTAHIRMVRAALVHLQAGGSGRVINIASTEGIVATRGLPAYTATKHGVIGLTKSLAVELGRTGVTVNCVCPGPILTDMTDSIPEDSRAEYARRKVALGRYGDPEEVAQMTLSLALPAASFTNGAIVVVDGGMWIRHT
ncbi:MAG: SDR family NAD(P)-dependent oxidoreductase [Acidimicrobiales bacterium]